MRPEAKLWRSMRLAFRQLKTWRVENPHQPGMPDVHFLSPDGVAGWMELKFVKRPKNKVAVTYDQCRWAREYNETGGLSLLVVKVGAKDIYVYCNPEKIQHIHDGMYCHEVEPDGHALAFDGVDLALTLEDVLCAVISDYMQDRITTWNY